MIQLTDKQINEIAQELESGLDIYINRETGEVKTMIDLDMADCDAELWEEELKEIEENRDQYILIEKMSSFDSFKIMRRFLGRVADEKLREKLMYAISQNKPFRRFRNILDYNGDVLEDWYQFKTRQYEDYVRMFLRLENDEEE